MSSVLLKAQNISKRFGGVVALDSLDLEVQRGEILGLIGPNGSGKTTFFNVLTGIYFANGGEITFEDRKITNLSAPDVFRTGISRTFQRVRLCPSLTIFDNVVIGDHPRLKSGLWFNLFARKSFKSEFDASLSRVVELLEKFAPHLVDELFSPVSSLPMIDRRRIEVCRALYGNPRLLLLDEPSAGMTVEETNLLMDEVVALRDRLGDLTIIIVEHEMDLISRITDRCVVLNFGKKICEGTYEHIAANEEVQTAYLGSES